MAPTIKEGQIVIVVKKRQYTVGDIVVARQNNREVLKRITSKSSNGYNLIGDNLAGSTDSRKLGLVEEQDVIGKVILTF
jgi:SOS-response transcriptional repressor LexA